MYLVSVYWIGRAKSGAPVSVRVFILVAAAVFRLTAWPLFPAFSNDIFRYHWEGKLQAEGRANPYLVTPNDPAWKHLRDETYPQVVLPEFKTIYGPVIELEQWGVFAALRNLPPFSRVFWFKLPSAIFDLLTVLGIVLWLHARGDPVERVLVYAWCPLPVFEFWINGHNDSLLICFMVLALWLEASGRFGWSAAALAMAVATKLWPAILWPCLFFRKQSWKSALWAGPVLALLAAPYIADVVENAQYASGFLGGWRNNDSIYGLVLSLSHGDLYRAKYATFALLALVVLFALLKKLSFDGAALVLTGALLAISANVHPWYLTWILPLLAVHTAAPLLLWVALAPLHYIVLIDYYKIGVWSGITDSRWLVYVPVYGFLAIWLAAKAIRSRTAVPATYSGR